MKDNQGCIYAEDLHNGENLYGHTDYLSPKGRATVVNQGVDATKDWYNSMQSYDFDKPGFPANVPYNLPHFTQVRSKFLLGNFGFKS